MLCKLGIHKWATTTWCPMEEFCAHAYSCEYVGITLRNSKQVCERCGKTRERLEVCR